MSKWDKEEYKPIRTIKKKSINEVITNDFYTFIRPVQKLDEIMRDCDQDIKAVYEELKSRNQITNETCFDILKLTLKRIESLKKESRNANYRSTLYQRESIKMKQKLNMYQRKYTISQKKIVEIEELLNSTKEAYTKQKTITEIHDLKDFYKRQLEVQLKNESPDCKRPSYPEELCPFYVLLSFAGEHWYCLIRRMMGLPSYRTVQKYRNALLKKYNLEAPEVFDGSTELIKSLKNFLWTAKEKEDTRCVLAIDAASINPQVRIDEEGNVTGFTAEGPKKVTKEEAQKLRESPKEYKKFIKENNSKENSKNRLKVKEC